MSESNGYAKPGDLWGMSKQRDYADVEVAGRKFCITSWTSREHEAFNRRLESKDNKYLGNLWMIQMCCVDPNTKELLFTEEDIDKLRDLDAGFVVSLAQLCAIHIGLVDEGDEKN